VTDGIMQWEARLLFGQLWVQTQSKGHIVSLLSTGWFQAWIQELFHNHTRLN